MKHCYCNILFVIAAQLLSAVHYKRSIRIDCSNTLVKQPQVILLLISFSRKGIVLENGTRKRWYSQRSSRKELDAHGSENVLLGL